jgi:SAM-dependent methyltransferase
MEPFDSFWEAPRDIEKGYRRFGLFYAENYLPHIPENRDCRVLVISCGPGYFVQLLVDRGYKNVVGIDSFEEKVAFATSRGLDCITARAFEYLDRATTPFDVIVAEQELNHLTKEEVLGFLDVARQNLTPGGLLLAHSINGANPLTGSESRAGNFDHYLSFTEYSLQQALEYTGYVKIQTFALNLYVFWTNPLNYVAWLVDRLNTLFFRLNFMLVGKSARIFSKKIGVAARSPS